MLYTLKIVNVWQKAIKTPSQQSLTRHLRSLHLLRPYLHLYTLKKQYQEHTEVQRQQPLNHWKNHSNI